MTAAILFPLLVQLLNSLTTAFLAVFNSQPPDVQKVLWERFVAQTQWISDALTKMGGYVDTLIQKIPDASQSSTPTKAA